jgi:hypothetical protein
MTSYSLVEVYTRTTSILRVEEYAKQANGKDGEGVRSPETSVNIFIPSRLVKR